jgi:polysaccharide export outer membrane protein
LFRAEPASFAHELDNKCVVSEGKYIPVIYEVNLRDPATYFLATQMPMRNKDLIYVSNSRAVEKMKLMDYIRMINGTIQDPINTGIAAYTLKGLINGGSSGAAVIVGGTATTP